VQDLSAYDVVERLLDDVGRTLELPDIPTIVIDASPTNTGSGFMITVECLWDRFAPADDAVKDVVESTINAAVLTVSIGKPVTKDSIELMKRTAARVLKKAVLGRHLVEKQGGNDEG
jgi:hypothetical protein